MAGRTPRSLQRNRRGRSRWISPCGVDRFSASSVECRPMTAGILDTTTALSTSGDVMLRSCGSMEMGMFKFLKASAAALGVAVLCACGGSSSQTGTPSTSTAHGTLARATRRFASPRSMPRRLHAQLAATTQRRAAARDHGHAHVRRRLLLHQVLDRRRCRRDHRVLRARSWCRRVRRRHARARGRSSSMRTAPTPTRR